MVMTPTTILLEFWSVGVMECWLSFIAPLLHHSTTPSLRCAHRLFCLANQVHLADDHALVHCLAHVVNREQRDRHAHQSFHLDSGLCDCLCRAFHLGTLL